MDPATPGFAERAAAIFRRDGFVAVKDVLDAERLETIRGGCDSVIRKMMAHDSARVGNRGSHRYSFGSAPAHFGHFEEWNALVDPPVLMECLNAIFQVDPCASTPPQLISRDTFCLTGCLCRRSSSVCTEPRLALRARRRQRR